MRNQSPIRWGICLTLLVAAVLVWRQSRPASQSADAALQSPVNAAAQLAKPVNVGPLLSVPSTLRDFGAEVAAVPPDPQFPNRLRNSEASMEEWVKNDRAVLLANALIDTGLKTKLEIPEHLKAKEDPGSYIVQSRGVINQSFHAQLKSVGAEVIAYIPNNAYLVRVDAQGASKLARMPWTRSVLPYEPYYKLQDRLLPLAVKQGPLPLSAQLRLTFFPGESQTAREKVEKLGAIVLGEDRSPFGPQLIVKPGKDSLAALAALPEVQTIEQQGKRVTMTDLARVTLGVATNSLTAVNHRGLTGTNIWVNVNDYSVDTNFPGLTNRVVVGFNTAANDLSGHGTHVASILAGSGLPAPAFTTNFMGSSPSNSFRGMAPSSMLYVQNFQGMSDAALAENAARYNLLVNLKTNTLISNNSWGYDDTFDYDSTSAIYDAATRDAIPGISGSQQMLFVFSVGNDGFASDNGLGGLPGSLTAPAAAKNVIAVGASEQLRYITNEVTVVDLAGNTNIVPWWRGTTDSSNQVAGYSGRGNTGLGREGQYGRFKPDVVAPGSMVIAGRSPSWDEASYYNPTRFIYNRYTNLTLLAGQSYSFSLFVPDFSTNLSIQVFNTGSLLPTPTIAIYTNQNAVQPSLTPAFFYGNTPFSIPLTQQADYGIWFYDLVNSNTTDVVVDILETIALTNNVGNLYQVLSNDLNGPLDPNYRFEVGTSMAAPMVSGVLALMQEFFETQLNETNNSPALYKALLINSARTLSENYGYETRNILNHQGWGLANLTNAIPLAMDPGLNPRTSWPIQYFDQHPTNALATGQTHTRALTMSPGARPFPLRVTLVWTDPPGNPAASLKLVNDLDLVVTNLDTGEVFFGNDFASGSLFSSGSTTSTNATSDLVNNVENVYLPGEVGDNFSIAVVARRVNVNAVTAHTNSIVQDYALVISTENVLLTDAFTVDQSPTLIESFQPTVRYFTSATNGLPFMAQRVGANPPLITTTNGTNVQWNFYVFTNDSTFTNVSFVTFLPPNLSGDPRHNTYRAPSADIDLYVSTDSNLTNLNSAVITDAFANTLHLSPASGGAVSTNRTGTEFVVVTNSPLNQVYYVGVKSEDQKGAEFGFMAVASLRPPFEDEGNGRYTVRFLPIPGIIPDGTPEQPAAVQLFGIVPQSIQIRRVVVTNDVTHELFGDLVGTLEHNGVFATLNNHTFITSTNQGGALSIIYDDSDEGDITGSRETDGPGTMNSFVGQDAAGAWIFTMIDNAPQFVGQIDEFVMGVYEQPTQDADGGVIDGIVGLQPGRSFYGAINVPVGVVRMTVTVRGLSGATMTGLYLKKNSLPSGLTGDYDHGKAALTDFDLTISTADLPPLTPGRYYVQVMNLDTFPADYEVQFQFVYDLSATVQTTGTQRSVLTMIDDTLSSGSQAQLNVTAAGDVAGVRVGVRIAHPRPSDLVLRISNSERSVVLAENRGGMIDTNGSGYGFGTNVNEIIYTTFGENTNTARQLMKFVNPLVETNFVPFVTPSLVASNYLEDRTSQMITNVSGGLGAPAGRLIDTTQTAGQIRIRYMFYSADDDLDIYDSTHTPIPGGSLVNETNVLTDVDAVNVDATTDTFTVTGHSYVDGDEVSFLVGTALGDVLPTGITARVRYYIVNSTVNTFQVSLTPGGTPVDITDSGVGIHRSYEWETLGPINYTSPDGILYITVNQGSANTNTLWDYVIELFDTGGVPFTPPVIPQINQVANRVAFSGTNLYVVGTTLANAANGIYARFGLPMQSGQVPFESVNWPFNAGGTRFHDITYSYNNRVFVAGDSYTRSTDTTLPKEKKGIAVRFPNVGLANLGDDLGSLWDTNIAGVVAVDGLEEMHAVITSVEGGTPGTEYVYLAGNATDSTSSSRLKVAKLNIDGTVALPSFEDITGAATVSAGRALAVLTNVASSVNFIYVAGFTDDDGTMRPMMVKFDQSLGEVTRVTAPLLGQFYGLVAYDGFLYAVGVSDALSGSSANFLVVKYDEDLNEVWSRTYDLGDEDILYGVAAAGNRIYAVGSTVNGVRGISGVDGAVLELWMGDGALVTRPLETPAYLGYTFYDGNENGTDIFRDVIMNGTDLYVVGEATQPSQTQRDAVILRYHVKDDYLPEESLDNFVGDVAAGAWRLEVLDNRTNYMSYGTNVPRIIDWQLQLFLADTNVTTFRLDNASSHLGTIQGGTIQYFVINAPMTASLSTHTLTVTSGGGVGLQLYYDDTTRPITGNTSQLMTNVVTTGTRVVDLTSSPQLVPGQRYFLAVSNSNPATVSTEYILNVTFDSSATTYMASSSERSASFADLPNKYHAYQFLVPTADNFASFELANLTGNVEVLLKRGRPPTVADYDLTATFMETNFARVTIEPTATMPDVSGFWYALVRSLSGPVTTYDAVIRPPNQAPLMDVPGVLFVNEGSLLQEQVLAADNDQPANQLTYSFSSSVPAGLDIDPATGWMTWTPTEAQGPGNYVVTVRVTDDGYPIKFTEKTIQVNVAEVNSAPVLPTLTLAATEGVLFEPVIQATDADLPANALSYTLVSGPAGMFINGTTGQINWTPGETAGGQAVTITVQVADNLATDTRSYSVFVAESNTAPVLGTVAAQTVTELTSFTLTSLVATDADVPAQTLTYRLIGSVPSGMQVEAGTGRITWTPTEAQGPGNYDITVEVEDNGSPALKAQSTFSITVLEANTAPVMTAIGAQTAPEGQAWSYQTQVTDADLPANTLTYSITSGPTGLTVTAGGLIQWTPTEAQGPGTYSVTVLVRDNGSPALGASRTFNITVTEANSAPTLNAIADVAVDEQTSLVMQAVGSDSDVPVQALTYKFTGTVPAGLTIGSTTGTINWSPTEAQGPASYPVTVEVSDGTATASRSFTITVNEVNLAPALGVIPNVTVMEGQAVRFVVSGSDADAPAQTLTYSLEGAAPAGASINATTGAFEWVTGEHAPNNNSLTVKVTDDGVPPLSAMRTFTITVNEVVTNVVDLVSGVAVTNETRYADGIVADIYRLTVTGQPGKVLFEAFNLTGNGDLLVRRGAYPTPTLYDYSSSLLETNREQVVVTTNATVLDLSGEWFATVINHESTNITYSISGTVPVAVAGGAMLVSSEGIKVEAPVVDAGTGTPEFSWTAVAGEKYQVEVSTDLVSWTPLTNIVVTGATATFTDPTPYTDSLLRFYRIRQVPQ